MNLNELGNKKLEIMIKGLEMEYGLDKLDILLIISNKFEIMKLKTPPKLALNVQ